MQRAEASLASVKDLNPMVDVTATQLPLSELPAEQLTSLRLAVLCDLPPAEMVSCCCGWCVARGRTHVWVASRVDGGPTLPNAATCDGGKRLHACLRAACRGATRAQDTYPHPRRRGRVAPLTTTPPRHFPHPQASACSRLRSLGVPVLAGSLYGFRGVMFLDYGDAWEYTFTCVASAATGGGERREGRESLARRR